MRAHHFVTLSTPTNLLTLPAFPYFCSLLLPPSQSPDMDARMIFAIALRAAAQLESGGFISHVAKAALKEKILNGDEDVLREVMEFIVTNDATKLMASFKRAVSSP